GGDRPVASLDDVIIVGRPPASRSAANHAAAADASEASERRLEAPIMYPADADRPLPVVVFVHGYLSNRDGGRYLARHLARQGYVVIAADHPHSSLHAEGRPDILDVVNQPGDVSALIDRVAALGQPGAPLAGVVDLARVGV